ncbi:hypothetical protein ADK38_21480, partial [Streptomyces varsoviensis]
MDAAAQPAVPRWVGRVRWGEDHRVTTTDTPGCAPPGYAALVQALDGRGLLSPAWRAVWEELPRHRFIPRRVWRQGPE